MQNETQQLIDFIARIHPLNDEERIAFESIWQPWSCKRKVIITAAGDTERHLYFVLQGIQRAYFVDDDGREATIVFTYPPSFSGIADSFLTQTPSIYFLESLSASAFLRTTHQQVSGLMDKYPDIMKLILHTTSFALKGVIERQVELQIFSAEQKFRTLLARSPHILQLVPHKYLASYLGIDAATFSKLLGTVRI